MQTVNDDLDTEEVAKRLRERLGDLSEAKDVRFDYTIRDPASLLRCSLPQTVLLTLSYLRTTCVPRLSGIRVSLTSAIVLMHRWRSWFSR